MFTADVRACDVACVVSNHEALRGGVDLKKLGKALKGGIDVDKAFGRRHKQRPPAGGSSASGGGGPGSKARAQPPGRNKKP